ncbi:MAG: SLC13 family permease [Henriciella sp.]|nr:SLC13 family permease [Henriciella sp.]
MTFEIALVYLLVASAFILFTTEKLSVDAVALLMVCVLVISGILTPAEAFAGFANEVIIILASVFVLSGALVKAGVIDWFGAAISKLSNHDGQRSRALLLCIGAIGSSVFSNTSATAVLLPAATEAARRAKVSPSRFLMPLAYASILGGTCTLIGTSTNLAGSGMAEELGLDPISIFEFLPIGLVVTGIGILWLTLLGDRFLPERAHAALTEAFGVREFLATLTLPEKSNAIGSPLRKSGLRDFGVTAIAVRRGNKTMSAHPLRQLEQRDRILVKATPEALQKVMSDGRFDVSADAAAPHEDIQTEDLAFAEAVLMPQSRYVGRTLKSAALHRSHGVTVLALYRRGHAHPARISNMRLKVGDVLLVQGESEALARLRGDPDVWGLNELDETVLTPRQGIKVLGALASALVLGATGLVPLSIAMLMAVLFVVLSRCISMDEAYRFIEWRLLVLIAGMTSFGVAMMKTGAAAMAAEGIVAVSLPFGPMFCLAAFAILTIVLTQPMSNAAAAITVMPLAVSAAEIMGIEPRSLAILVTLSASLSFITPLEPASLLVYGPGKYKFTDFIRAGIPLTVISLILLLVLVPLIWPL